MSNVLACKQCGAEICDPKHPERKYCSRRCAGLGQPKLSQTERFWKHVTITPHCWEWLGKRNRDGYGIYCVTHTETQLAHRMSWRMHYTDPGELCVLHHCDNPACVKPAHLFLGTQADNLHDMCRKKRNRWGQRWTKS